MTRQILPTLVIALLASPAAASVSLDFITIDNSALLTGYNTFDLQMNTPDSDWTAAVMLMDLTAGSIYQHIPGVDGIQNPAALPFFYPGYPAIVFDTYVIGSVAGGGGDLDGSTGYAFDTGRLDVSWFNTTRTDIGSFPIARITLSDDAVGTWSMLSTTADEQRLTLTGSITDGAIEIETEMIELLATSNSEPSFTPLTFRFSDDQNELGSHRLSLRSRTQEETEQLIISLGLNPADAVLSPGVFTFPDIDRYGFRAPLISFADLIRPIVMSPELIESDLTASTDTALPEPGTLALLSLGAAALLRRRG